MNDKEADMGNLCSLDISISTWKCLIMYNGTWCIELLIQIWQLSVFYLTNEPDQDINSKSYCLFDHVAIKQVNQLFQIPLENFSFHFSSFIIKLMCFSFKKHSWKLQKVIFFFFCCSVSFVNFHLRLILILATVFVLWLSRKIENNLSDCLWTCEVYSWLWLTFLPRIKSQTFIHHDVRIIHWTWRKCSNNHDDNWDISHGNDLSPAWNLTCLSQPVTHSEERERGSKVNAIFQRKNHDKGVK